MVEEKRKKGFQKGVASNPNGKKKGTLNKSTLDYLAFRNLVVDRADEALKMLWSAMEIGEGWAHTIYWKELVGKMRFNERSITIPYTTENTDSTQQLAVLLKNLPRFENYTHDELLATIKTLSAVKANENMVEQVANTLESRDQLVNKLDIFNKAIAQLENGEDGKE